MYDLRLSNADLQGIRAILSRISYNTRKTVPTFLDGPILFLAVESNPSKYRIRPADLRIVRHSDSGRCDWTSMLVSQNYKKH